MSRSPRHRPERLSALIQSAVASALTAEVKDPRVGFVTVTHVRVAPDASFATVYVSVLGEEPVKAAAMEGLHSARGFLRSHLARVLPLRTAPELRFVLDRTLEEAARIERLLADIQHDEPAP
ncbi:MAG TPA: 30S ribosome-binding factor RbfA [Gemmatimonadales bacterium]|nr:30S ribosome-binding factor RbfA [Gemmatimonadales bacterium]